MTVLMYVDTSKQVGDPEQPKVLANADAAEVWFAENDPEGGIRIRGDTAAGLKRRAAAGLRQ